MPNEEIKPGSPDDPTMQQKLLQNSKVESGHLLLEELLKRFLETEQNSFVQTIQLEC